MEGHVAKIANQREELDRLWRQLNTAQVDTVDEVLIKGFNLTVENVEASLKPNPSCFKTETLRLIHVKGS